jgi:predicted RNase H-like nuclease (RuvC/YqgF family)
MEPKNSKIFSKETMQAVSAFCESKEIKDVDNFIYLCFKQGFDIRKYGLLGETGGEQEKWVEKEIIVEKRVEVPIEVIKEVEKIVEVPVEVIKEVPVEKVVIKEVIKEIPVDRVVEKIIQTSDDTQVNELLSKIDQLNGEISTKTLEIDNIRQEFSTKTEEMENIFQNEMSKKDEELDELRRNLDIFVTNDKTKMLQETLQNLRSELQQKNEQLKELEKINRELLNGNQNQAYLMRGSNLNRRI